MADFDAADVAAAILGLDDASPQSPSVTEGTAVPPRRSGALGWFLLASLVVAVAIAISLAVQWTPASMSPPEPPACGGLFSDCCDDDRPTGGLFDAEDDFRRDADC